MVNTKSKISQLQHETDVWKRTLEDLLMENALLKNRLAEILNRNHTTVDFLNTAEQYQSMFIQKDEIINLIRQDVAALDKLLVRDMYNDGNFMKAVNNNQKNLRKELKTLESNFNSLKNQFNNYVSVAL